MAMIEITLTKASTGPVFGNSAGVASVSSTVISVSQATLETCLFSPATVALIVALTL